jgi:hypothetical protein
MHIATRGAALVLHYLTCPLFAVSPQLVAKWMGKVEADEGAK